MAMVLLLSWVTPAAAHTCTPGNLMPIFVREDFFYEYDFVSKNCQNSKVDWAVDMVYWNNASVSKVKNIYKWGSGSTMYAYLSDGSGGAWDSDNGAKTGKRPDHSQLHFRPYAYGGSRMYNVDWGYYVIATTHYDWYENEPGYTAFFGYSETAEQELVSITVNKGYDVWYDHLNLYNYEYVRWDGDGLWMNDGYATTVDVYP
jgi:hypothetical protein